MAERVMTYERLRATIVQRDPWVLLDITEKWGTEYECYWCEREQTETHTPDCLWLRLKREMEEEHRG